VGINAVAIVVCRACGGLIGAFLGFGLPNRATDGTDRITLNLPPDRFRDLTSYQPECSCGRVGVAAPEQPTVQVAPPAKNFRHRHGKR
jgi:hypothetical protein